MGFEAGVEPWRQLTAMIRVAAFDWSLTALWITALLTLLLFLRAFELTKFDKRADVLMHSNARYDDLLKDFGAAGNVYDPNIERRYWAIFGDNFEYFLLGYLDGHSVASWAHAAHLFVQKGEQPFGFDLRESWNRIGSSRQGDSTLALIVTEIVLSPKSLRFEEVRQLLRRLYDHPAAKKRRAGVRNN